MTFYCFCRLFNVSLISVNSAGEVNNFLIFWASLSVFTSPINSGTTFFLAIWFANDANLIFLTKNDIGITSFSFLPLFEPFAFSEVGPADESNNHSNNILYAPQKRSLILYGGVFNTINANAIHHTHIGCSSLTPYPKINGNTNSVRYNPMYFLKSYITIHS